MFQVLIADDDSNIRAGLCRIVEDTFGQEVICLQSENGMSASQIIENNPVDILITDIKMPVMTGIDLLEFLKKGKYPCRTVVLSGFDDYNLVRDALRLGAVDYLLKPVDIGLLLNTMRNLMASIDRDGIHPAPGTAESINNQILVEYFVAGTPMASGVVQSFLSAHSVGPGTWCALCYVDTTSALYSAKLSVTGRIAARLAAFENSRRGEACPTLISGELGSFWLFLALADTPELCQRDFFIPFLKDMENGQLKWSFSDAPFPLADIRQADARCRRGFERFFFDLPYAHIDCGGSGERIPELVAGVTQAMAAFDYARAIEQLNTLFALLGALRPPIAQVQKLLYDFIYGLLSAGPDYISVISESKFTDNDILYQIENAASLSALQKDMFEAVSRFIETALNAREDKDDYMISKAKSYIRANFADSITLGDVAAHVFLHSNYFSTLFKNKTGVTFRQFLRDVRVEKAKELLRETPMKIYEVAQAVGYNEAAHFVRAFKEVTGQSPGGYKHTVQERAF